MKLSNLKAALLAATLVAGNVAQADVSYARATGGLMGGLGYGAATATLAYAMYNINMNPRAQSNLSELGQIGACVVFLASLGLATSSTNAVNYVCGTKYDTKEKEIVNVADAIGTGIAMGALNHEIHRPRLQPGADFIFTVIGCGLIKYCINKITLS